METDCKYILWFVLKGDIINSEKDILFGITYIPPEGTKYSSKDAYSDIENEYTTLNCKYDIICLTGDFNSRVSNCSDFINDIDLSNYEIITEDPFLDGNADLQKLDNLNFPRIRSNKDLKKNNFGNNLLHFCKNNNLFILNGRVGNDKGVGDYTTCNSTVIDYFIGNVDFLNIVENFCILEFTKLYSDVHCPLTCNITCNILLNDTDCNVNTHGDEMLDNIKPFNITKCTDFCNNISVDKIVSIFDNLNMVDVNTIDKKELDVLFTQVCDVLVEAAKQTFGTFKTIKNKGTSIANKRKSKDWFTTECFVARKQFRKTQRMYRKYKSNCFKLEMRNAEKHYKNVMDCSIKNYRIALQRKIKKLRSSNPGEYWKLINKKKTNGTQSNISVHDFYTHFKNINTSTDSMGGDDILNNYTNSNNDGNILNECITGDEIMSCVRNLKTNKSSGIDRISNEYIISSIDVMLPIYVKLFNIVLETGIIPESWLVGNIIPVFKNKGSINDVNNYRPITLLSCMGKLFTSIMNIRLNNYVEEFEILCENQSGFRKNYSTVDNIFILHSLIELLQLKKRKLYCAFIDFQSAFDKVWRYGLWQKLLRYNITGKCFKVIVNMYRNTKSRISVDGHVSEFFSCNIGVRQGENLSPLLFALYMNDLEQFFIDSNISGIKCISEELADELNIYLKLFLLLYADDTVLMSESISDLQCQLDNFSIYCKMWKLTVNIKKTKIMVFSKGKVPNNVSFHIDGIDLEIVKEIKYLGVFFSRYGSFLCTKKYLAERGTKAMYGIIKKARTLNLSIDCQIDMFDKMVLPILLYGSEIWGFEKLDILERVHLKFCKLILKVRKSTPSFIVYGELGRVPLYVYVKTRIISYWSNIIEKSDTKYTSIIYKLLYNYFSNGVKTKWISSVEAIFQECGMNNIWLFHNYSNRTWLIKCVKQKLYDQFLQSWYTNSTFSRGISYNLFTHFDFKLQLYLTSDLSDRNKTTLSNFRCSNHKLPIEVGRWKNIPRENRLCELCNTDLGDEYHYILCCTALSAERSMFIPKWYIVKPNTLKFYSLFNNTNLSLQIKLSKFIKIINERIGTTGPPG